MTRPLEDYDFFDTELMEDPFEFYARAHAEAPVLYLPKSKLFLVTSYELVCSAGMRPEIFSSSWMDLLKGQAGTDEEIMAVLAKGWPFIDVLITNDPPSHSRFRKLVQHAFSGAKVAAMHENVSKLVNEIIDEFIDRGRCEFVADFAVKLPVAVIADALGDNRAMTAQYKKWSDAFMSLLSGLAPREEQLEAAHSIVEFQRHFFEQIQRRRADLSIDDLVAGLVHAKVDGEQSLSDPEILSVVHALMLAGNETTTNALAGGMLQLIRNPDQRQKVRDNPALVAPMVEEILRIESPAAGLWRRAKVDTELGGVAIPQGSLINLRWGAANRDPKKFQDPGKFDVERANVNQHVAFGRGIHVCIGAMLSRRELAVAFPLLLTRLDNIRLAADEAELRHVPNVLARGLQRLPISFERAI